MSACHDRLDENPVWWIEIVRTVAFELRAPIAVYKNDAQGRLAIELERPRKLASTFLENKKPFLDVEKKECKLIEAVSLFNACDLDQKPARGVKGKAARALQLGQAFPLTRGAGR